MVLSVVQALVLGLFLIVGMNFCIENMDQLVSNNDDGNPNAGQVHL